MRDALASGAVTAEGATQACLDRIAATVITSYSIHYTKLYENTTPETAAPEEQADEATLLREALSRAEDERLLV